jgi:hypothetical protein
VNPAATRRARAAWVVGAAVLAGAPVLAGPAPAAQASPWVTAADDDSATELSRDPLEVVIRRLTPGAVPDSGPVTVAGEIRNRSEADWSDLKVYLLTSADPLTTRADLAAGLALDPTVDVGDRIIEPDLYQQVPDLAPGESTEFRLSVPRSRLGLSGKPGVYWLGVHVLGTAEGGRATGADGRARTFLPLIPPGNEGTRLALGIQLRNHTVRAADGRLEFLEGWQETFGPDGRLGRLLELALSAESFPLTWVVDPAVLESARSVVAGNPAVGLGAPPPGQDGEPADDPGGTTGADAPDARPEEPGATGDESAPDPAAVEGAAAQAWLDTFTAEAGDRAVLALPYGDLDVTAASTLGDELIDAAFDASAGLLDRLEVPSVPVVAPPTGLMSAAAVAGLPPEVSLVLAPAAVPGADAGGPPLRDRIGGGRLGVAPPNTDLWGPTPGAPRSALAVRQRLLADAALHALSSNRDQPLVRLLPYGWDPGEQWERARFFRGLDVPWLTGVDLGEELTGASASSPAAPTEPLDPVAEIRYPEAEEDAELPFPNLNATERLIADGRRIEELLTDNEAIDDELTRQALLTSSVWSRPRPGIAAVRARGASAQVEAWLSRITVRGPSFVTMSSGQGTFQVTLVNGLDHPVTVGLRAGVSDESLDLTVPEAVELPPRGRGPVRIDASATDIGIHLVTLQPVSASGTALGESSRLSIRTSNVGFILWVIMGVGGAALFVMIAFRIVRRITQRRRTHGPLLQGRPGAPSQPRTSQE